MSRNSRRHCAAAAHAVESRKSNESSSRNSTTNIVWHPFTQMRDWLKREPIVIASGKGAVLRDVHGTQISRREFLHLDQSPRAQSSKNQRRDPTAARKSRTLPRSDLPMNRRRFSAEKLVGAAGVRPATSQEKSKAGKGLLLRRRLHRDGSRAETRLRIRAAHGRSKKPKFLSLDGAYHGDTVGAVSLGHIDLFHKAYPGCCFKTDKVASAVLLSLSATTAPNPNEPMRANIANAIGNASASSSKNSPRKRKRESLRRVCLRAVDARRGGNDRATGRLAAARGEIARGHGAQLIADEVMTGFGRTGCNRHVSPLLIKENVQPDFLALAKGLTGGYLPMAATLTTQKVFDAFLGEYDEFKTFFHGHSFTGNQLGASAALASLEILQSPESIRCAENSGKQPAARIAISSGIPQRRRHPAGRPGCGHRTGEDWRTREPFDLRERAGIRVCEAMAKRGVLTRPIGNVIVLMPPYCMSGSEVRKMVSALGESVREVFGKGKL